MNFLYKMAGQYFQPVALGKGKIALLPRLFRNRSSTVLNRKSSLVTQTDDVVEYPPIKPKYPPGTWGNMNYKYAWQWQDLKDKLMGISNLQDRQNALLAKETLAMLKEPIKEHRIHNFEERVNELIDEAATVLKLNPFNNHPAALQFRKYATKTHVFNWKETKPKVFDNINTVNMEEAVIHLKNHIFDHIYMEYAVIERIGMSPSVQKACLCKSLIRCISESLIFELGKYLNHLQTCHYDEDVIVRALWSRHGLERKKRLFTYDPDNAEFETVEDQPIASEGLFDAMVRSHLPLPEFESAFDGKITELESPKLVFKPSAFGEGKPGKSLLKSISAGHRLGDPCEYGLIGILSTCNVHEVEKNCGPRVAHDCRLAMGLTNTFTWLAAQACNQGFSHVIDLSYPLTSQTILTDGEKFSFLAYQLNTLELWKDATGNKKLNLCWITDEMPLYHSIEQGKVREFNDDVLAMLVNMFMLTPAVRAHDMKPTVSDKLNPIKSDYIQEKVVVEEVVKEEQFIVP